LDGDAVSDEEDVDGSGHFSNGFDVCGVEFEPVITSEMAGGGYHRPKVRKMAIGITSGAALMLGFLGDVRGLCFGEGPSRLLRVAGCEWVIDSSTHERDPEEEQ
jgi:hypothetical protein